MTSSNPNILQPRRSRSARSALEANLERVNALSTSAFASAYLPSSSESDWSTWTHPRTQAVYNLTMQSALELADSDFQACYELIEQTSEEDYRSSSMGWSEAGKKREMRSPELRYILIRPASSSPTATASSTTSSSSSSTALGFVSLMPTFEANQPVVYLYEIHLSPALQGSGLGAHLVRGVVQPLARAVGCVDKVMLTCFRRNEAALGFYGRMGFAVDESSPADRRLRGGRVVTSDYVILSWGVGGGPLADGGGG